MKFISVVVYLILIKMKHRYFLFFWPFSCLTYLTILSRILKQEARSRQPGLRFLLASCAFLLPFAHKLAFGVLNSFLSYIYSTPQAQTVARWQQLAQSSWRKPLRVVFLLDFCFWCCVFSFLIFFFYLGFFGFFIC